MKTVTVRSRYLRALLTLHPPTDDNLDRYRSLLALERLIVEPPRSWSAGMLYTALRNQHPDAFAAMAQQLSPALYREELARERKRRQSMRRFERERLAARRGLLAALKRTAGRGAEPETAARRRPGRARRRGR
jgi:hypothetical protein